MIICKEQNMQVMTGLKAAQLDCKEVIYINVKQLEAALQLPPML